MLGQLFNKAVTATISLGMMLFSSYQGNTPYFHNYDATKRGNYIRVQSSLENAFNEDFRQILQSGQRISITFELEIKNETLTEIQYFEHIIEFDPLLETWTLNCEEQDKVFSIDYWEEFVATASSFNYAGNNYLDSPITVTLKASLPKIHLGSENKEFDLMIFWNFHNPGFLVRID